MEEIKEVEMKEKVEENPQEKVIVVHLGSFSLKVGLSTDEEPTLIPNCIFIPNIQFQNPRKDYCASNYSKKLNYSDILKKKENQVQEIRKNLLIQRNILKKEAKDDEVYFEEIQLKGEKDNQPNIEKEEKMTFGNEAIESSKIHKGTLLYPIRHGYFNITKDRNIQQILEYFEKILEHVLLKFLTKKDMKDSTIFLVIPDHFDPIELKYILKIVFKTFYFKKVFIHTEGICASFGAGLDNVCVVDLGESKTTISVVEEGYSIKKSQYYLPFGGFNLNQLFHFLLEQSNFNLKLDFDKEKNYIRETRESGANLMEGDEFFQTLNLEHGSKIYRLEIGDPLFISSMGYFNNSLLLPFQKKHKLLKDFEEKETVPRKPQKDHESLDEYIIESIKKSEIEILFTVKKKTSLKIDVLLVGGNSLMKGLSQYLEKKLTKHYSEKHSDVTIKINVMSGIKSISPIFLSWKGASIVTKLESFKEMCIKREEFECFGLKVIRERVPFKM